MGRWTNRLQEQVIIAQSACANFELEAARGMPLIRAFRRGSFFSTIHERFLEKATSRTIILARLRMITHPIQIVLFLATLLLVYIVGLSQVKEGALTQGNFFAFIAGLSLLHAPLSALSQDISTFLSHREMRYLEEILSIELQDEEFPAEVPDCITANQVAFQYHTGPKVFQNLSFHIKRGEILGFSGGNGSGKSTLAMILAGILCPTEGEIIYSPDKARLGPVSYVDQQGTVFSLSLRDNLFLDCDQPIGSAFGSPMFYQQLMNESLALLSPETLSSGQKKLVSMERALHQDHTVFIIDEPENSLDSLAQQRLLELLNELQKKDRIVFLFSHSEKFLEICTRRIEISMG